MLAIDEKDAKKIGGKDGYVKIAVSEIDKKFAVYLITHNCYKTRPCLQPKRIDSLLTDSDWLEVACKKYRLPAKEIRKLKKVWALGHRLLNLTISNLSFAFAKWRRRL